MQKVAKKSSSNPCKQKTARTQLRNCWQLMASGREFLCDFCQTTCEGWCVVRHRSCWPGSSRPTV